jgi:hypothetical protein
MAEFMNKNSNYSALKETIAELTEVIDRTQPNNEEAGNVLKRMDSVVLDIENRLLVRATHHTVSAINFSVPI